MFLTTSHFLNSRFLHGHVAGSIIEWIKFNKPSELKRRVSGSREPEQGRFPVLLRDHPLMSYKGVPSWPPVWTWIDGREDKHPKGEVGILKTVLLSTIQLRSNRCFLLIFFEESSYMGCLLFDDEIFCSQITKLLQGCTHRPIAEIGSLDLSYTL